MCYIDVPIKKVRALTFKPFPTYGYKNMSIVVRINDTVVGLSRKPGIVFTNHYIVDRHSINPNAGYMVNPILRALVKLGILSECELVNLNSCLQKERDKRAELNALGRFLSSANTIGVKLTGEQLSYIRNKKESL